jgi:hypothetical protein
MIPMIHSMLMLRLSGREAQQQVANGQDGDR